MSFFLKSKKLDFSTGNEPVVVINEEEAEYYGVMAGDRIQLTWNNRLKRIAEIRTTTSKVKPGEVGLFKELWNKKSSLDSEIVEVEIVSRPPSIQAIRKKIFGKKLNYDEIYSIIKDIVDDRFSEIETTYYVASSYLRDYTLDELYYTSKAVAETGEMLNLNVPAVDKHSVGGLPGNRTTMVVVPIVSSLGLYIPKTSSRAITSPSGTADTMEVLAPVTFSMTEIKKIVKRVNACMVWGGGVNLAPADDKIVRITRPLGIEPYDKMIVSIMAKKVAMGVDYLVLDLPIGPTTKIPKNKFADEIEKKFLYLAKKFGMKVKVVRTPSFEPVGRGIGPALEARDVLRVLQQKELRPVDLEKKAVRLSGYLLELAGFCKFGQGEKIAQRQLISGEANRQMKKIIAAQGGNADIDSDEVALGALNYEIHAKKNGRVVFINNKAINEICVNLGAPSDKIAGIHMHVHYQDKVRVKDKLFTFYAQSQDRIKLALKALEKNVIVEIK